MPLRFERRRVVVIEHQPECPLDRFQTWLGGQTMDGTALGIVRPYAGDPIPERAEHGLIVLGGQMSAYDDGVAPWLPVVRRLLATAVAERVPTLGICLGAQLLAVACGGRVDVAAPPGRESGVVDARHRPEAAADELLAGLPDPFPGPSMHADAVVELPAGATWLASSAMYPHQAFRVGRAAWGVQFHPEVSLPTFRSWAESHPEVDVAAVTAEFADRDREVAVAGRRLAERFAAIVVERSTSGAL
ncbi:MAG TPA: type 1 glutamine amidotransferase [Jiangellaceae bacterium]|nr:type 1 glutamine amidotransferase [Jiangellaceae bacterium]